MIYMNAKEAPAANQAECYVTINGQRHLAVYAKDFEAKMNISSKEVPSLGRNMKGRKVTGGELKFSMTIYKATELYSDIAEEYKNTGFIPTFDIQVTNYDKTTSIGRSTKIYKDCVIDGDLVLSAFDAAGDFIEQKIEGYCNDFESPEKYTDLPGMF